MAQWLLTRVQVTGAPRVSEVGQGQAAGSASSKSAMTTRLRPSRLARYRAVSASRSASSNLSLPAMAPMLGGNRQDVGMPDDVVRGVEQASHAECKQRHYTAYQHRQTAVLPPAMQGIAKKAPANSQGG